MNASTGAGLLLEEQHAELLLRFRRREVSLTRAITELAELTRRPEVISDAELASLLAQIDQLHRARLLRTHADGPWAGAPTGAAIAQRLGVGKVRLRAVRDAYYSLHLGLRPFNADEPQP